MTDESTPSTVHVLGGGPSGLSAAFHLAQQRRPDLRIVVHQMGWRLGGKGATGRDAAAGNRIEEHGIHLFGNMYANALHMMNDAFGALDDGRTIETEFEVSNFQMVTDFSGGRWHGFESSLPHNDELPWEHGTVADPAALVTSMLTTIEGILSSQELPIPGTPPATSAASDRPSRLRSAIDFVRHHSPGGLAERLAGLLGGLEAAKAAVGDDLHAVSHGSLLEMLEHFAALIEQAMSEIGDEGDLLGWIFVELDLLATIMRGCIADEIFVKGIDSIDGPSYQDWLRSHGASDALMRSSILLVVPNTCMSYADGDSTQPPTMSAAAFVTFILRQIVAPGNAAYFFKVGTGETVILPLYEVLLQWGVEFEFFTKVLDVVPSDDGSRIGSLVIERQAALADGVGAYEPLAVISGGTMYMPSEAGYEHAKQQPDAELVWPNVADFGQLADGAELRARGINLESWWADWAGTTSTLTLGPDDAVVVAIPPRAQAAVCTSALAGSPAWGTMIDHVETAATQALQIWLDRSTPELGWRELPGTDRWLGPSYTNPISAFADFTRTLASESWPAEGGPKGLIYFCGVLQDPMEIPGFDDHAFPDQQTQRVRDMAAQYLRQLGGLLPYAAGGGNDANTLDYSVLHCYDETGSPTGENRVDQQFFRANIDPNERYTVSAPGTLQYRLNSWESGYANCALCSDAIFNGFNIGSFEASVAAGKLASLTVSGLPDLDHVYGFEFLRPDPPQPPPPILPPPS
ncbi:MAG: NAD(P)-binding protein [Ilumatobacteraceae bacterium]|nr:NAD(P)-binding protein [Ilumatobacteraceae bacterium]